MKHKIIAVTLALMALLALFATAAAEEDLSPEALDIAGALNCPVCAGESVRDSNAPLSRQMRAIIQEKLDAGESRQEIFDYFVARYGETVLREPPKEGFTLTLWWMPVVGMVVGAVIVGTFIARRVGRGGSDAAGDEDVQDLRLYEDRLNQDLERSDLRLS